jgi:hypothetical protein
LCHFASQATEAMSMLVLVGVNENVHPSISAGHDALLPHLTMTAPASNTTWSSLCWMTVGSAVPIR